jgi:hypothetical protein
VVLFAIPVKSQDPLISMNCSRRHSMDAFIKSRTYRGGMHWKKAKGNEYHIHQKSADATVAINIRTDGYRQYNY